MADEVDGEEDEVGGVVDLVEVEVTAAAGAAFGSEPDSGPDSAGK